MCYLAVFDTDFISKAYRIQNDLKRPLIDCMLDMIDFQFFCHEKVKCELRDGATDAYTWLDEKIKTEKVTCYTDARLINEFSKYGGETVWLYHRDFLSTACRTFSNDYFQTLYPGLEEAGIDCYNNDEYVFKLQEIEKSCLHDKNIGEIKSYVLMQALGWFYDQKQIIFCSDYRKARKGIAAISNGLSLQCMSVVSSFQVMKRYFDWSWEDAYPYIQSLIDFYDRYHQHSVKVLNLKNDVRKLSIFKVLEGIFSNQFILLKNGELQYKSNA